MGHKSATYRMVPHTFLGAAASVGRGVKFTRGGRRSTAQPVPAAMWGVVISLGSSPCVHGRLRTRHPGAQKHSAHLSQLVQLLAKSMLK